MPKIFPLLLTIFISLNGVSYNIVKTNHNTGCRMPLDNLPNQQIKQLQSGALLVRLKTKKNSIAALRKHGKHELADKIQAHQDELNKEIINAFKTEFDFCPTYFFFSDYSKFVKEKLFDSVQFLNENLIFDPNIKMNKTTF